MITAGISSIPKRSEYLKQVVERFLPEVDKINVTLDNYIIIPEYLYNPKIQIFKGEGLGDAGKFIDVPKDGVYLGLDDDLIYPSDYIPELLQGIDNYGIVTFHGANLKSPFKRYYRDRVIYPFYSTLKEDKPVQVGGTGVMAFDCEYFRPVTDWFKEPNMSDIFVSLQAMESGKQIYCLAHRSYWIRQQRVRESISRTYYLNDRVQTDYARKLIRMEYEKN